MQSSRTRGAWASALLLAVACGGGSGDGSTTVAFTASTATATAGSGSGSGAGSTSGGGGTGGPSTASTTGSASGPDVTSSSPTSGTSTSAADASSTGGGWDGVPGEFSLQIDGRDYQLYVPGGYDPGTAIPLVVGFHGAGDTGSNFYAVSKAVGLTMAAEPAAFALVIPDTKSPYHDFAVWSGNPNNDGDAMLAEMTEILALVDDVGTHYHLDPNQLHAFGFSDGGLFVGVAGLGNADRFASLAVLGYGWGSSYPIVTPSRKIPVQFACGESDMFYSYAQAAESFLSGQGHDTRLVSVPGVGHDFIGIMGTLTPDGMFAWMAQHPLP